MLTRNMQTIGTGSHSETYRIFLVICILSFAVFAVSLGGDFIMDEVPGFVESTMIKSIKYWPSYFTTGLLENTSLGLKDQFLYRPLNLLYASIMYHIFGLRPFMFHLMNVLLHTANSIMVFFLARTILKTKDTFLPSCAALLFVLHPVHVEAVAWIGGGVDVFMTFLFLLSFLSYVRYRRDHHLRFFIFSCFLYVLDLLYKETAIILPALVFLYDFTEERKVYWKRLAVLFLISVVYFIVRTSVLGKSLGTLKYSVQGLQNVLHLVLLDIKFLFFPWPMGYKFQMPKIDFGAFVALPVFIVLLIFAIKKNRKTLFPALWIFVPLAPPLMLAFASHPVFGDRFLYLPSIGFVIILASLFDRLRRDRKTLIVLCSLLAFWGAVTAVSSSLWKNDEIVYSRAIRNSPKYIGPYVGLALYYERKGQFEKSVNTYLMAVENLEGRYKAAAYDNIAYLYGTRGYSKESIFYYKKELEIDPQSTDALIGLGNNYLSLKEYAKAIDYYMSVLPLSGKNLTAYFNLALAYEGMGNEARAAFYYRKFIAEAPPEKYRDNIEQAQRALESYRKAR